MMNEKMMNIIMKQKPNIKNKIHHDADIILAHQIERGMIKDEF